MNKEQRKKIEEKIYKFMDILDNTGSNTNYYKDIFSKMSDNQFTNMLKQKHFIKKFLTKEKSDNTIEEIEEAAKYLNVPIFETITLPSVYKNKEGIPVSSKPCIVGYCHIRREQQFASKKNSMSTNTSKRDMKTGLLTGADKNGKTSDREFESLTILGLEKTIEELNGPRADSMNAKNVMYNDINLTGSTKLKDIPKDPTDSISLNLFDTYMMCAGIETNVME